MMHVSCHAGGEARSAHHDQPDWGQHLRGQQLHGILKGGDVAAAGSHLLRPNLHTDQRTAYSVLDPANDPCLKTKGAQDAAHKRAGDAVNSSVQGIPVGWCKTRGMYACMHGQHKLSGPKAAHKYKTHVANVLPAAVAMDGAGALDHLGRWAALQAGCSYTLVSCVLKRSRHCGLGGFRNRSWGRWLVCRRVALSTSRSGCAVPQAWQPCVSPDDM